LFGFIYISLIMVSLFLLVCLLFVCVCDDRMARVLYGSRWYYKWFWRGVDGWEKGVNSGFMFIFIKLLNYVLKIASIGSNSCVNKW